MPERARRRLAAVLALLLLGLGPAALYGDEQSSSFLSSPSGSGEGGGTGDSSSYSNSGTSEGTGSFEGDSGSYSGSSGFESSTPFPAAVTDLAVAGNSVSSATLVWTAPVADYENSTGTVASYLIRYSTTGPISNETDFSTATAVSNSLTPLPPGWRESFLVQGLAPGTTYHFAVEAVNSQGVQAALSNIASTTTLPWAAVAGCGLQRDVHKTYGPYGLIQDAVDDLPTGLTTTACVVVHDSASYSEQVTVQGFTFSSADLTLRLLADPALSQRPVVAPPDASTAAFHILNASVAVIGFHAAPAGEIPYGVLASSDLVTLTSITVSGAGYVLGAGIAVASYSAVSYSSVSVETAHALWIAGSGNAVSYGVFTSSSGGHFAAYLSTDAQSNALSDSFIRNVSGHALLLGQDAKLNEISYSTITTEQVGSFAAYFSHADTNTITQSFLSALPGRALHYSGNASFNQVSWSTAVTDNGTYSAVYINGDWDLLDAVWLQARGGIAVNIDTLAERATIMRSTIASEATGSFTLIQIDGTSATITQSDIATAGGRALRFNSNAAGAVVSFSTIATNSSLREAVLFNGASSNTIASSFVSNPSGDAVELAGGAKYNLVELSTLTSAAASFRALYVLESSSNSFTGLYLQNLPGAAARFVSAHHNAVTLSTAAADNSPLSAFLLEYSSYNALSGNFIGNPSGNALAVGPYSDWNTVAQSTLTTAGANRVGLFLERASNNSLSDLYSANHAGGGSGGYISDVSNGNEIQRSTFVAAGAGNVYGLLLDNANFNRIDASVARNGAGTALFIYGIGNTVAFSSAVSLGDAGLRLVAASSNTLSHAYVQGSTGVFVSGSTSPFIFSSVLVATGSTGAALRLEGGSVNLTLSSTSLRGGELAAGLLLEPGTRGQIALGSVTVSGSAFGLSFSTMAGGSVAVDSATFRGLAPGATAIHFLGGTFVSTFTLAAFEDASVGANANASALDPASRITMKSPRGPRRGSAYENDPFSLVDWDIVLPAGCALGFLVKQDGSEDFTTITGAVNALPKDLNDNACIVVKDGLTYQEQVTVQGFTIQDTAEPLRLLADPALTSPPVVEPPAFSTAAFELRNARITLEGLAIIPASPVQYGVLASSAFVTLSSVSVDAGGSPANKIWTAGVLLSSWSVVDHSSVTVGAAHAFYLPGSTMTTVSYSSAVNNAAAIRAVYLRGAKNNSFIADYMRNLNGVAVELFHSDTNTITQSVLRGDTHAAAAGISLQTGSDSNTISFSTITAAAYGALFLEAASNTVTQSYMQGVFAARIDNRANYNAITLSTMVGDTGAYGLYLFNADSNTVSGSFMSSPGGHGASLISGSDYNAISLSTMIGAGGAFRGLTMTGSASNTVTGCYVQNLSGTAASLDSSHRAAVSYSTFASNSGSGYALYLLNTDSAVVTGAYLSNPSGPALYLEGGSDFNTIALSTAATNSTGANAAALQGSDYNRLTRSVFTGGQGRGLWLLNGADDNLVEFSSITARHADYTALLVTGSSNTVRDSWISQKDGWAARVFPWSGVFPRNTVIAASTITSQTGLYTALHVMQASATYVIDSYVQASTAAEVLGSTNTVFAGSVLAATDAGAPALRVADMGGDLRLSTTALRGGAQGAGLALESGQQGLLAIGSVTVSAARQGIVLGTATAGFSLAIDSVTFRDLAAGSTAIHFLGGTFVSTITLANFEDASVAVNVNGAPLDLASRITMKSAKGARRGPQYENDPNALVDWDGLLPAGCDLGFLVKQDGSEDHTTLQGAVDALPKNLAGTACVMVKDSLTYAEQVTVQGFTFSQQTQRLRLFADPALAAPPVIEPPGLSTAAFELRNASVTVAGLSIIPSAPVQYGVFASSSDISISSVSVDAGGSPANKIWTAGVRASSSTVISHSSVTVQNASALWLSTGALAGVFDSTGSATGGIGLYMTSASSATVSRTFLRSSSYYGGYLANSNYNQILRSSFTSPGSFMTVWLHASAFNLIDQCYIASPNSSALSLRSQSTNNLLSRSTVTASGAPGSVAAQIAASSNTFQDVYAYNFGSIAADMGSPSNNSLFRRVRAYGGGSGWGAMRASSSLDSRIEDSWAQSAAGPALTIVSSPRLVVVRSTAASAAAGNYAITVDRCSSCAIVDSYAQGAGGLYVYKSTSLTLGGSIFVATNTAGFALYASSGNVNLSIATSTLYAQPQGVGLRQEPGDRGLIALGSVTVSGAAYGLVFSTMAGGSVAIDSVTFRSLAAGATAIHLLGGTFVATITLANFEDSTLGINVNGAPLALASRITMKSPSGPKQGPSFENDPFSLVDWPDQAPPGTPSLLAVYQSSITVAYGLVASDGYRVEASTRADFEAATILAVETADAGTGELTVETLFANSTYYLRAAAIYGAGYVFHPAVLSTSTLARPPTDLQVYRVAVTSITANWKAHPSAAVDASSMSAEGYLLQVSTNADFNTIWTDTATPNVELSTLAALSLYGGNTYYLRVGALNWNGVPNYSVAVSTLLPIQLGVYLSTHALAIPGLVDMNYELVITTSIVAQNVGNVDADWTLRVTTTTGGSPWQVAASTGVDRYAAWAVVNSTQPAAYDFGPEDRLDDPDTLATGTVFTMGNQTATALPPGALRTLWFKLNTPSATSTGAPQQLEIRATAVPAP